MSVVACRVYEDRIEIASDSISVSGCTQRRYAPESYSKLLQVNGLVIGGVGRCEEIALFMMYCATRKPSAPTTEAVLEFVTDFADWKKTKTELEYGQECDYILVFEGKAFYIERFWVSTILDYSAIGAGMDYALSALYLGHDVHKAVETSCELSIYCEPPVQHIIVEKRNGI